MATSQHDTIMLDQFGIYVYPKLNSNFAFIDAHRLSTEMSEKALVHVQSLGYSVTSLPPPVHAGGTGWLPGLFDQLQMLWEHKALATIPFAVIKGVWRYYTINKNLRTIRKSGAYIHHKPNLSSVPYSCHTRNRMIRNNILKKQ